METRGATDGTSGEILTREGVVALKALITDTSNQIFDLATNADLMIAARQAGGNQFDRMVDRLETMLGLHKQRLCFTVVVFVHLAWTSTVVYGGRRRKTLLS